MAANSASATPHDGHFTSAACLTRNLRVANTSKLRIGLTLPASDHGRDSTR